MRFRNGAQCNHPDIKKRDKYNRHKGDAFMNSRMMCPLFFFRAAVGHRCLLSVIRYSLKNPYCASTTPVFKILITRCAPDLVDCNVMVYGGSGELTTISPVMRSNLIS